MSGQTTRIRYIDIMKAITILLVMVGHYFNNRLVSTFIWSFHMPLFLFISGYFSVICLFGNVFIKPLFLF